MSELLFLCKVFVSKLVAVLLNINSDDCKYIELRTKQ
jgi:hypothetical protein